MSPIFGILPLGASADAGITLTTIVSVASNGGWDFTVTGTSAGLLSVSATGVLHIEKSLDNVSWVAMLTADSTRTVSQILAGTTLFTYHIPGATYYIRAYFTPTGYNNSNTVTASGTYVYTAITLSLDSPLNSIPPEVLNPITFFMVRGTYAGISGATLISFQLYWDTVNALANITSVPASGLGASSSDPNPANGACNYWNFNSYADPLHTVKAQLTSLIIGSVAGGGVNIAGDLSNPSTTSIPVELQT